MERIRQNVFPVLAALIWGTAFVAQSVAADHVEPFTFTAARSAVAFVFLLVLCLTGIGTAYQMPVITGIIRGGGDAKFGMINDLITIWGLVIPLSLLAAFVLKWSPAAVVLCLNADQLIKCIAGAVRVNRYRWIRRLTRPEG